jgi:hypothetical protein
MPRLSTSKHPVGVGLASSRAALRGRGAHLAELVELALGGEDVPAHAAPANREASLETRAVFAAAEAAAVGRGLARLERRLTIPERVAVTLLASEAATLRILRARLTRGTTEGHPRTRAVADARAALTIAGARLVGRTAGGTVSRACSARARPRAAVVVGIARHACTATSPGPRGTCTSERAISRAALSPVDARRREGRAARLGITRPAGAGTGSLATILRVRALGTVGLAARALDATHHQRSAGRRHALTDAADVSERALGREGDAARAAVRVGVHAVPTILVRVRVIVGRVHGRVLGASFVRRVGANLRLASAVAPRSDHEQRQEGRGGLREEAGAMRHGPMVEAAGSKWQARLVYLAPQTKRETPRVPSLSPPSPRL